MEAPLFSAHHVVIGPPHSDLSVISALATDDHDRQTFIVCDEAPVTVQTDHRSVSLDARESSDTADTS